MTEKIKDLPEAGNSTYKVKFTSRKFKEVFPFTGKGKITFVSDEILLHGYLERKSKLWFNAILVLPLFGLSFFLIVYVLFSGIDPGSMTTLDVVIQLVLVFGLLMVFLKIINPKSDISVKRISVSKIQKGKDGKTIRFSAIYPGTEKEGTIMIEFKSTETANKFIEELSTNLKQEIL